MLVEFFFRLDDTCLLPGHLTFFSFLQKQRKKCMEKIVHNTLNSKEKRILICRPTYVTYVIALFACAFDIWPLNYSTLLKLMLTYAYQRAGIYRRSIFEIRLNILIGLKKLRLRPKDRSRLFIYWNFLRRFSFVYPTSTIQQNSKQP